MPKFGGKVLKLGGKVLKLSMWMGALILAGLVQGARDAQDVLRGPAFSMQESGVGTFWAWNGREHRDLFGCVAILMAETEPLMQACYLLVKRRPASLMINEQRSKIRRAPCDTRTIMGGLGAVEKL